MTLGRLYLGEPEPTALVSAPEQFPGEHLIVCRNPLLAQERARKREDLLAATERALSRIEAHIRRKGSRVKTAAEIGIAVGAAIDRHKMAKHFALDVRERHLSS